MRKFYKVTIGIAASALLVGSLAACSTAAEEPTAPASSSSSSSEEETPDEPLASIPSLTGVDTQVTVDQGFVDAITSLGLTPGVVGTATFTDGVFAFPITGGNVDYYGPDSNVRPYVQGEIIHDGSGISLSNGTTTVELTDFRIDPGSNSTLFGTVTANGAEVGQDLPLFRLDGTTLNPIDTDTSPGNAILEGTTVYVSDAAADLLNQTFGTDAVTGELEVGIAKITAAIPAS